MKRSNQMFALFVAVLMVFGLVSVSAGGQKETGGSQTRLVVANTAGEPGHLHPYNTVSMSIVMVGNTIYDTLMNIDSSGALTPALATSWESKDDEIIFNLRKGVKFHNGEVMKAEDVVFSLKELMIGSTGGYVSLFENVDSENIVALDDYTVRVPLKTVDATIISNLANMGSYIINKKAYLDLGDQFQYEPVGTGPFKLKSWTVGDNITVERFNDYWGGVPQLESVVFRTISETSQAMIELETGGVDLVINPQGMDVLRVLNGEVPDVKAVTEASAVLRNNNLNINWLSEKMKNHKVREAIAHTIDREAWTPIISPGNGIPAYSNVAAGIWGFDPTIAKNYPYDYNIDKAKKLMVEAGYADGFEAILLTDGRPYHQALAELLQASLSQIGIILKVKTMELGQQIGVMSIGEGYDLYLLDNVGMAADPLSSLWRDSHPRFAKQGSTQAHYYTVNDENGQQYADLLDAMRVTTDLDKRKKLSSELQKVFVEDIVWLPINSIQGYFLVDEALMNVGFKGDILFLNSSTRFE